MGELSSPDNSEYEARRAADLENIWTNMTPEVEASLNQGALRWMITHELRKCGLTDPKDLSSEVQDRITTRLGRMLGNEERFVKEVYGSILDALRQDPIAEQYLLLSDLDETLLAVDHSSHSPSRPYIVRPAAAPLMRSLRALDARVRCGILTSWSRGSVVSELQKSTGLQSLLPYLDQRRLFSSSGMPIEKRDSNRLARETSHFSYGVVQKVLVCERLLSNEPATSIVMVDDTPEVAYLPTDTHFRSVAITQETQPLVLKYSSLEI